MKLHEGVLSAEKMKVGIVASRFNDMITKELLAGALDCLKRHGVDENDIHVYWVPGALEIPRIARELADSGQFDGVVCLGAVIRGATPHFDIVANEASKGIARLSMESDVPVIFGVLTTENIEQALERAGTKAGNKGWDAALNMIEMANLIRSIRVHSQK
ncbi:MAG TPA: 6,7-dimethyl-8-ribityllumazine synthase [Candidatus Marinimicrobia bacterium]|nr:6,7-dimethyl-8-ribityllumazine synthase [Candidatus Neomarinimicrobiota bacterium]HOD38642.1 6,7-dimethyl-8-ribityllumazine synthase [Candidatus Neomarinimicrobiota bacterium]HOG76078.1 6,7-dimethyl-8-ribityllumazine synthase [Candidatus Neomarinimicrobiota bacterium]HOU18360.1 6,7-dimethyl-8-ribityllumazine synthase [Candidatus Neomarinimicrobiota bacterium]HPB00843.1 6,7-dimethyl-8-ribityllumazine synthase [Candidatus Neomarinimicrobiota bacterium]